MDSRGGIDRGAVPGLDGIEAGVVSRSGNGDALYNESTIYTSVYTYHRCNPERLMAPGELSRIAQRT